MTKHMNHQGRPHKTRPPATIAYRGLRTPSGCQVIVIDDHYGEHTLPPRLDLRNHSPDFEWGYGSGPAQLALAILADALADNPDGDGNALTLYQEFTRRVIAPIEARHWVMTAISVRQWCEREDMIPDVLEIDRSDSQLLIAALRTAVEALNAKGQTWAKQT